MHLLTMFMRRQFKRQKVNQCVTLLVVIIFVFSSYGHYVEAFSTSISRSNVPKLTLGTKGADPRAPFIGGSNTRSLTSLSPTPFLHDVTKIKRGQQLQSLLNAAVLTASLSATSKLLASIGIGALATPSGPKQFGRVLDGSAVSALSKLTYWLFQPCFLLCGVAGTLASASAMGAAVGGSSQGGLSKSSLFLLPMASLVQIGLGFVAAKIITTRRFGIRPNILGIDTDDEESASDVRMCTTFANSGPLPLILADALFNGGVLSDVTACVSFYLLLWSPLFWTFGRVVLGLNNKDTSSMDASESSLVRKIFQGFKKIMSPPVVGSILGFIIGSTEHLRNLMLSPSGILSPLYGALKTFGFAYLPAAVLVLAGSLTSAGKAKETTETSEEKKSSTTSIHPKTILAVLLSRFFLSPILALTTVRLLSLANLLPVDNARSLAIVTFTLLMEGCMPPAQNSVILLQLEQKKDRAAKMAKMLTVIYALSAIPVTLLLSGCLGLSGIMNLR